MSFPRILQPRPGACTCYRALVVSLNATQRARALSAGEAVGLKNDASSPLDHPSPHLQPEQSWKMICKPRKSSTSATWRPKLKTLPVLAVSGRGPLPARAPQALPTSGGEAAPGPIPWEGGEAAGPSAVGCPCARLPPAWGDGSSHRLLQAVPFPGWNRKPPGPDRKRGFRFSILSLRTQGNRNSPARASTSGSKTGWHKLGPSRDAAQAAGGFPHYLYAVQLLGQDAEKVLGEVAQQGWVPVTIAPLARHGSRAQHIDAGG